MAVNKKPMYVIFARKPTCHCIVAISYYGPELPLVERKDIAKEVGNWAKEGLLITTVLFDESPLLHGEEFGCNHGQQTFYF